MGIRATDNETGISCIYDSVTELAFGPIFHDENSASAFLEWYASFEFNNADLRTLNDEQWRNLLDAWGMSESYDADA